ncbi:hypothetical protein NQ315_004949 [Exocentrus adspersus]|uniref:Uncharacterized protein n=1 Tax=Exocentrus adspersus TaxID=1586481 RepID=A0AAV8W2Z4_9CUCU|nr:hypothetical protein NQ315_004949 [Exocentrus adspersus]
MVWFEVLVVILALLTRAWAQIYPYTPRPFALQTYSAPHEIVISPTRLPVASYVQSNVHVPILRQDQDVREDGVYQYGYETANGIAAEEHGGPAGPNGGTAAQGSYTYTSPEGRVISISYVADENGFRAVGDAIPTPPPIPPAIARSLAYIAAHPQPVDPYNVQRYY